MKNLLFFMLLAFTGCENYTLQFDTTNYQQGALVIWLLYNQTNYESDRADICELHFNDTLSNEIDNKDKVKAEKLSDNIAIASSALLEKEYRKYPAVVDTINLTAYNLTRSNYYIRILGWNFPGNTQVTLYDPSAGQEIAVDLSHNMTFYHFSTDKGMKNLKIIVRRF